MADISKIKETSREFRFAVAQQTRGYLTAAFGLVAGIAWNDAVRATIDSFYSPDSAGGIIAKFIYAAIMTLVAAVLTFMLTKISLQKEPTAKT